MRKSKQYAEAMMRWSRHPRRDFLLAGHDEATGEFEITIFDEQDRVLFHETHESFDTYSYDDDSPDSDYTVTHLDGSKERSNEVAEAILHP